jgi:ABC-type antimicrobial peptide transport system permease subunit
MQAVTAIVHDLSPDQPVERPATLEVVRAEELAPERLNAFVLSGFAGVALLIAVVGVAGVLAFSVSARFREFGVRLALGSTPRRLMTRVLLDGVAIVTIGMAAGAMAGVLLKRVATSYLAGIVVPGLPSLAGATAILMVAALVASLMPAIRASRVDVLQALRSE